MDDELFALDPRTVAEVCGVTERAARGWRQRRSWPPTARRLLRIVMLGDMEAVGGRAWRGWTMSRRGELVGPDGECWDTGRLGSWWIERQQIPQQRRELDRYRDGVPIIDRAELARLQRAQEAAATAAHELARLFPESARAGARNDQQAPPAPALAVSS